MIPKPEGCRDCPMYQDGLGFVPDSIEPNSILLIVGQNPGRTEEKEGKPFVGSTGELLRDTYIPKIRIPESKISYANVIRCRWENSNDLPPRARLNGALQTCRQYDCIPTSTQLIVAQGALAWEVLSNKKGSLSDWRGYIS
jgi:uracil-DNA glycosylase family 4